MTAVYMTDEEIVRHYRLAKAPREEPRTLADLNGVTVGAMQTKLAELGLCTPPSRPRRHGGGLPAVIDAARAAEMFAAGKNDIQMADALGVSREAVQRWRTRRGMYRYSRAAKSQRGNLAVEKKENDREAALPPENPCPPRERHHVATDDSAAADVPAFSAGQLAAILASAERFGSAARVLVGETVIRGAHVDVKCDAGAAGPARVTVVLEV